MMQQQLLTSTPYAGEEHPISEDELRVLAATPVGSWRQEQSVTAELSIEKTVVAGLLDKGLLLSDQDDEKAAAAREREERYVKTFWNPYGALYHFRGKWRDQVADLEEQQQQIQAFEELPPPPFYEAPGSPERLPLPKLDDSRSFHELLRSRRTTRSFDADVGLPLAELSAVLFDTYGCHGIRRGGSYAALKRNAPSGGAMHPIEAFLLVQNVLGLAPGLYHYDLQSHSLALIRALDPTKVRKLALEFVAGQEYFAAAHVLSLLAVRHYRHSWKYRRHSKSYRVVLMDAAHLSQTFFLVCTERGLGAFFTAAINEHNIEEELGLDPLEFGVVGINGCGIRKDPDPLALVTEPFEPGVS